MISLEISLEIVHMTYDLHSLAAEDFCYLTTGYVTYYALRRCR